MPSGKTHDKITWYCLPLIIILFLIITQDLFLTLLSASGFIFSGLMFGPDLDIYSVQFKRWYYFRYLWLPYQKLLKHRSFFSHGFIIGTFIRVLYLSLILFFFSIFIIAIAQLVFGFSWHWQRAITQGYLIIKNNYWQEVLSLFIGLELGAMSHYLADGVGSWWKSRQKKKNIPPQKQKMRKNSRKIKKK